MFGGSKRDGTGPGRAPRLATHQFRWDPFERARLAFRGASPRRRIATAVGASVVVVGALVGLAAVGSGDVDAQASLLEREKQIVAREAEVQRREQGLVELDRKRAAAESELQDSAKRVAALESRRADLQRQIADLAGPVAPIEGEPAEIASRAASDETSVANDAAVPDEAPADDVSVSASSRSDETGPDARSNAEVDARSTATPDAAAELAVEPADTSARGDALAPAISQRVFIHIRSADPIALERARAVAAELRRRGVTVVEIRGVLRPVRRDAVRFFYDADRAAVATLQDAVRQASSPNDPAPQPQDFRGYRAPPKPGTLELWLS